MFGYCLAGFSALWNYRRISWSTTLLLNLVASCPHGPLLALRCPEALGEPGPTLRRRRRERPPHAKGAW